MSAYPYSRTQLFWAVSLCGLFAASFVLIYGAYNTGVITAYGWTCIIRDNISFIVAGVLTAMVVRALFDPRSPTSDGIAE